MAVDRTSGAGWVLSVLFLANLLNFYDRVIPTIVIEPIRVEFGLNDSQIGLLVSAFTVVYALAGLPLGWVADRVSRRAVMGAGLAVWSALTALTGGVQGFGALMAVRLGIGVGEASCAPAAQSVIADLYPANRRARAMGFFMLGLPVGLTLSYFTVGWIADVFGSWRAPFFVAAVPGAVLAVLIFRITEPARGAAEEVAPDRVTKTRRAREVLRIPTVWWLVVGLLGYQFAAYVTSAFNVPLFQRYFGFGLASAATVNGVVLGLTGVVGLLLGGWLGDRAARRAIRYRVLLGAVCMGASVPLTFVALRLGPGAAGWYVAIFSVGWILSFVFYTCGYPALADVVEPRLRARTVAMMFALAYLLGGGCGPIAVGALSDALAERARAGAGAAVVSAADRAVGLHDAMMVLVPLSLLVSTVGMLLATRTVTRDRARMQAAMAAAG
ncbi:spinster family MFS transporter [Pseudonocardia acaciae]|uniref:spinster family MFS transporter n=1 Tax=Pseudonocardia acaciae TaxID=551276 RepID=UPI00048A7CBE|nr:MFS transporter [Pseudonocardia acaciae]